MFGAPLPSAQNLGDSGQFPDPFCDYSSVAMPRSWDDALRWCQFIVLRNPEYQAALRRIVAMFITDIEVKGDTSDQRKRDYKEYLYDHVGIMSTLSALAMDYLVYGTSVSAVVFPFRRFLSCSTCGYDVAFDRVANEPHFKFQWQLPKFFASCPQCKTHGEWRRSDRQGTENDAVNVWRPNLLEMELMHCPVTGRTGHIWKPPGYYVQQIKQGDTFQLSTCPWRVLSAIANNNYVEFSPSFVYHMAEPTLCGVPNRGWGFPRTLTNLPQAWYVQVLRRTNEAIGLDYVFPFRLITPAQRSGSSGVIESPIFTADMHGFTNQVQNMIRSHRQNPTQWHTIPYPVEYQALGGEASQMVSEKLLEQGVDHLVNAIGLPAEIYRASLTVQTAVPAMRMLQSNWVHLVYALNRFLAWLGHKISARYSWDDVRITLVQPAHADDLNHQLARVQLMAEGQISQQAALPGLGLDPQEEVDRKLDEQLYVAERTQEAEEEMEAMGVGDMLAQGPPPMEGDPGMQGDPAMGGAPGAPADGGMMMQDPVEAILAMLPDGHDPNLSPQDLEEIAIAIAQAVEMLPEHLKQSVLRQIKQKHEVIHALVRSKRDSMRNRQKLDGVAMHQEAAQQAGQQQVTVGPQGPMQ